MTRSRRPLRLALVTATALVVVAGVVLLSSEGHHSVGGRHTQPIDPRQQTAVSFGERSHWLQPWRAYLDTVPAIRLREAIGIHFNAEPEEAERTAQLLARSGFRRARLELGWGELDYEDPTRFADPSRTAALLRALRDNGLRPLILLNANHVRPTPALDISLRLLRPAPRGARDVRLDRDSTRAVRPGRTGIDSREGKAADVIVTHMTSDGRATLSKPLAHDLTSGTHDATTLRYAPFGPPRLADGSPNPAFERTLAGWLDYVGVVTREARRILGSQDFDVEVWNELSFGSDFLYQDRYYDPPRERGHGDVTREILERTVAYLRDPAHGVHRIGIGDGFANQTPFPAGSTSPRGLTAIDKHPYDPIRRFPRDATFDTIVPLDADGEPSFRERVRRGREPIRRDRFVPTYDSFFPEYALTAIQTETLIRDLSPITTDVYGTLHGRQTHPPGGSPPTVWITETNLVPAGADPREPGAIGGPPVARLTTKDVRHMHAKAALRYFTAYVNKGVSAMYLFAVKGGSLALVHPEEKGGGETLRAVRRLTSALRGAEPLQRPRRLSLREISDDHNNKQFEGDGTLAHPPLYDRDVVAFLPFEVRDGEYVAATYVMTRNLAKLYDDGAESGYASRYDLPAERFRLRLGGVDARRVKASATDPLTGRAVPVQLEGRTDHTLTVELPLTDSPRLLRLSAR
jgi:hypothetical protein